MKNKKIIAISLLLVVVSVFASCKNSKNVSYADETQKVSSTTQAQALSFTQNTTSAVSQKNIIFSIFKKKKPNTQTEKSTVKDNSEVISSQSTESAHSYSVTLSTTVNSRPTSESGQTNSTSYPDKTKDFKTTEQAITQTTEKSTSAVTEEKVTTTVATTTTTTTAAATNSTVSTTSVTTTTRKPVTDAEGWINGWY